MKDLFGRYTYSLPEKPIPRTDFSRFFILYGENGSGKTTILRLLFCTLSPVPGGGYKTAIARTPFSRFTITFNDGTTVNISRKQGQLLGPFDLKIVKNRKIIDKYSFAVNSDNAVRTGENPDLDDFVGRLSNLAIDLYMLPDNRRILGSTLEDHEDDDVRDWIGLSASARNLLTAGRFGRGKERPSAVEETSKRLLEWVKQQALQGSTIGEANANEIYLNILNTLVEPKPEVKGYERARPISPEYLLRLGRQSEPYSNYGFTSEFPAKQLASFLKGARERSNATQRRTVQQVLRPYVQSVKARLDASENLVSLLTEFLNTLESFFADKHVLFTLQEGLKIEAEKNKLIPLDNLSSGEKQLLLMLCNIILARQRVSIFIIDEPEISLNVAWQRRLLRAFNDLTRGANIQFVLATHSLEILSSYRKFVVKL